MNINLEVESVTVMLTEGQDIITLTLKLPTTHPELGYPPYADIKTRYDFGIEWCKKNLGIEPKIINTRFEREKFSK